MQFLFKKGKNMMCIFAADSEKKKKENAKN